MADPSNEINREISALVEKHLSLELATASKDGVPCASYAPFVCGEHLRLYVFLSDLALHTANLGQNPKVSAMIIEDESNSQNLFARNRLVLDCEAARIHRGSVDFEHWIAQYKEKFGAIVDTLVQLADFNLYCLIPTQGTFVKGFGQAYKVSGELMDQIKHITNPARDMKQTESNGNRT